MININDLRMKYEKREQALLDEAFRTQAAEKRGKQIGEQIRAKKNALEMLKDNLPLETIAKYSGLSINEIQKLQDK